MILEKTKKQLAARTHTMKLLLTNPKVEMQHFASKSRGYYFFNLIKTTLVGFAISLTVLNIACAFFIFVEVCLKNTFLTYF